MTSKVDMLSFQHHGITIFVHELVEQNARNVLDEYYFDCPHDNAK
jgi:hypothetical protein